VFYVIAIATIPFAILSYFCLPRTIVGDRTEKRSMDVTGISVLTGGLILFVYALSDGSDQGWSSPQILVTLILSVFFFAGFFVVERISKDPALPPRTWRNKNFAPMFFYAWSVYWNLMAIELQLTQIFQDLFFWSPIKAALHFLPLGITGGFTTILVGTYGHLLSRRVLLISGQVFMLVGSILLAFASTESRYWSYILPAMIINMVGLALAYVGASVTMMAGAPKGEEGVVGAVLYTTFQVGATVGIAVAAAIQLGVNSTQPSDPISQFKGYQAGFFSLVGMHGLMIIVSVLFVRN